MKPEILNLAKEVWKGRGAVDAWFDECAPNFETFYVRAQAQALRDAADILRYANDRHNLLQLAEVLESKI